MAATPGLDAASGAAGAGGGGIWGVSSAREWEVGNELNPEGCRSDGPANPDGQGDSRGPADGAIGRHSSRNRALTDRNFWSKGVPALSSAVRPVAGASGRGEGG